MPRLQVSGICLSNHSKEKALTHACDTRVALRLFLPVLLPLLWGGTLLHAQTTVLGTISRFAGQCNSTGFAGDGALATGAKLGNKLGGLAIDPAGNVYIADTQQNRIRQVDTSGIINTVAGSGGGNGFGGDGGLATAAAVRFSGPQSVTVNPNTNPPTIFMADAGNNRVRAFTVGGNINTAVGGGNTATSLTPITPLTAKLASPQAVKFDAAHNLLYITDNNNELLKWDLTANTVVVVVGNALVGGIKLATPTGVALNAAGVPYIAESGGTHIVSKFENGVYSVVAGGGGTAIPTNGTPITATSAKFAMPLDLAFDSNGFLYVTDTKGGGNGQLYRIDLAANTIQAVAGTGANGCTGDGGPALSATLQSPDGIAITSNNRLYVDQDAMGVVRTMLATGPPASVTLVSGAPQVATVGTTFNAPFVVVVMDATGNPLSGITVNFAGGGEVVSPASATTDINGQAQTSITASTVAGAFTVSASVSGVSTPATGAFTNLPGAVTHVIFATQPTGTTAGTIITPAVTVQALDIYNNPVSGVTIVLSAQGGPGSLGGTLSAVTGTGGLASFSDLKLEATGTYTLQATDGVHFATSASFIISPAAGGTITPLAGDGQSARLTQQYASQLEVIVKDGIGNPIPNASVTFTAPATAATVTFTGSSTVATNAAGVASVAVTAAGATGTLQVTASAAAAGIGGTAVFNLTNLAGDAQQLHFVTQPSNAAAGVTISPSVTVQLQDSTGAPVAEAGVEVTLSAVPVPSVPLSGATAITDSTGLATFSNLMVDTVGTYFLTATAPNLVSTQSTAFTISGGAVAKITVVSGTPQSAIVLGPFAIPLRVMIADSFNNPISGVTVTFAPPTTGPSATLSSTSEITDSTGLASVSATANGFAGGPYNVTASVNGFSATFSLTNIAGAASSVVFSVQPVDTTAGAQMAPVTVKVTDSAGNPVSGELVALSAQGGLGVLSGMTPTATDMNGLATFTTLSINLTGTYSLQAQNGVRFATSTPFVVNPGTAASITVVAGSGESAPVGSFYPSPLRASVQDMNGNAVPGVPVTFTAPSSGASVTFTGSQTVVTDSTGVASVSVAANAVVGSFEVDATAPGTPNPAIFQLENIPGTASQLRFVAQPLDTEAGEAMADVTVQITDNVGNPIALPGVSVALTLNPVVGRLRSLSGMTVAITDGNGLATFSGLIINTAGLYQLTAIATALASAQSSSFTIFAGAPATITATAGTPQSTTVLAPFAVPLQVIVTDSLNNPLSGQTVTFTAPTTGASANLPSTSSSTAVTDASGHASVTAVANGAAGSYSVTASVNGVTPSATFALTNLGGAGASLSFSVQPSNAAAGAVITPPVVLTVTDNGGNPVSGVTVSLTAQGGPGVLSGATPVVTDTSGHAEFDNLSIDLAGTYSLQATDGTRFATSNSFVIGPGTASSITVVAGSGQSAAVNTPYATALKASVQDAEGNGIPGVAVTFTAPTSGASVTFSGSPTVTTDSTGVASISVTANTVVGMFDVTATAPGTSTPAVFALTNVAGAGSQLAFVQQPSDTVAGAIVTPAVTVQLTDNLGHPIAQSGVTITLALVAVAGRLRSATGTLAMTDSNGLATFPNLSISTVGTYQLTASGTSLVSAQSATFHILTAGAAAIQEIAGTPQSTTVLGPFAVPLQVLVTDSFGNPLSGVAVTFTAPSSGASADLSATTATTDAAGHASVSATANATAGMYTVTASVAGVTTPASFELTNLGGAGVNLVFTTQPVNTPAGSIIPSVVVRVTDNGGNPVSGVTIALTAQGGTGTLSGAAPVTTGPDGLATFSNLSIDRTGTYALQATDGTRFTTSNAFVITPATTSSITIVAGNGQSTGVGTNYVTPLRVSVQDSLGNPIPGVSVTFTAPTSGPSVTFLGSPTVTTDGSGVAGIFVTANNEVGSFQVTATASGIATPAMFSLTNLPGTASRLKFVQEPSNTAAGAVIAPPITVQLTDNLGNAVAEAGVTVTLSLVPVAGPLPSVSGTTTVQTNGAGLATFSGLSISTAGSYQFTALGTLLVSAESTSFTISTGAAASIQTVAGTPQSTTVFGPFPVPLQVLVTDSFGNPLSGVTVTFTPPASGASATLSSNTATTDAAGHASVSATADGVVGSYTVTASVGGLTPTASFALTNLIGTGSNLVFTQQPVNTAAGAIIMPAVVVRVTDAGGNPVSGVEIALTAQGGTGTLSGAAPVTTDPSGLATFSNLSINKTGTYALQATDGTRFSTSNSFLITPATTSSITVVAGSGQSAVVGGPYATALKASVQDAQGNGIPGVTVTFAAPSTGASVTFTGSPTVTTGSTGVASISVTANTDVGSFNVTATANGIATPATFSLTNLAGTASRLAFVQQPSNAVAGAVITPPITVQLTDDLGHAINQAGLTVTLALNPVAGPLPAVSGTTTVQTNGAGIATFSDLSISTSGTYQFTALGASLASIASASFTISNGVAAAIQAVAGTPQTTTVFGPFALPLQVLVTDSFGNPLSGVTVTFTAPPATGASATLTSTTATTDGSGHASVSATANGVVGAYSVSASAAGVASPASFALTNVAGVGSNLTFIEQPVNTSAGATIPPVEVRVTDNGGNPVSGVTIVLTAQGGPGTLSGAIPVATDASGIATFSNLSIDKTGTYALQATDGTRFTTSSSFLITPGTSSTITAVAGDGQSAVVGAPYATALKASVRDAQGNGIPGVSVTFAAPASGASVTFTGTPTVTTDSEGVASISVTANTDVGSFQVTATAASTPSPAVFSLTNLTGTATRLVFVQQPSNAAAGAIIAPPVTVQLTDELGHNVAQAGVTITLALVPVAGPAPSVSGATTVQTNAAGLATFSALSIATAGSYQFTALGASLASVQSNSFTIANGTAAVISTVAGTPQSTTVLAPFAVPLQVLVTDSFANPLSGVTVTFTEPSSGASATLSSTTATTDTNGHASVSATADATAGSYTVTASVAGVTPSASFALTNVIGTSANIVFTQQPVNTAAGAIMPAVVVHVTDTGGNPVSGVTVVLSAQGGPGTLSGAVPVATDISGNATFSNLSIDKRGTYALQATDGTRFTTSSSFLITPGTSMTITAVAGSGQSAIVGGPYATALKASVQDAQGNGVPGIAVTFTTPTSGASVTFTGPTTVTTDSTGAASISVTANTEVGSFQVTASAASGTPAPAIFSLTNLAGAATRLAFVQQPSNTAAGATIAPPITVQLTDELGHPVAQAGMTITLALSSAAGPPPPVSGATTVQTNSSGLATFSDLSISAAGTYQFTALGTSLASAQSTSFTIANGTPAVIQTVAGTPQSTTIFGPFAVPLQVLVTDSFGNPLSGVTVTFTAPASGASATLSSPTATTDTAGHASVSATADATQGSYTVTASVSGVTPSASFALTNLMGVGSNLTFTIQPVTTPAGDIMPSVTVRVTDSGGNPVSGVSIALTAQGGSGTLSGNAQVVTNSSGLATFSNLSIDKTGTYVLQATDGTRFTTSSSFLITPGTTSTITAVAGSGQSAVVGAPYATVLRASVRDAQGNGIPGVSVTFAAPASGASVTFTGSTTVTTGSTGTASISVTANTDVGSFQVTATAPGTPAPAVFSLTNLPGTADRLTFVQQPSNTAAGAIITPPITVQLTDDLGHNVAQAGVAITLALVPVAGTTPSVSGATTVQTNANGLATFSDLSISVAGTYQFTALGASLASVASASFTIANGTPALIQTVSGTPQSTTIFGPFAVPLEVLVTDSFGNPLSGVTVTFMAPASGASAMLSATTATTDTAGHASISATANGVMGSYTVSASVAGVASSVSFALTNVSGAGSNLTFTTQPVNTPAGAIITPPVVVRVTDNGGNPVSGVTITLTAQGGPGTLSGAIPVATDASGLATFSNLSIDRTGTYFLQATDGTRFAGSASFVITPATSSSITVVAGNGQSALVTAPYATPLKVSVQDTQGNGVPGVAVTFAAPSSGASVTFTGSTTVTTDSSGLASISVTANANVGAFQVTATAAGISTPATFSLTNLTGTADRLSFVQQPSNAAAGAVIAPPITVQLVDSLGHPVAEAGATVTLSLNPTAGPLVTVSGTTTVQTDSTGLATFSGLSIATAGSYQFTALGTSLASVVSNSFTVATGAPATIQTFAGTPQSTTVLGPFAVPLQVLVTDSFGNPLSGVTVTFAAPSSGASANLSAATATTDAAGHASVTAMANAAAGSYTVTASVAGVATPASFALTNLGGAGVSLAFTQQPVNTVAGAIMSPVAVHVTDAGGNPVSGVTIALTAQGGPGTLSGAAPVVTDSSGLATFSNLSITKTGTYALQATDGTRFTTSNSFLITPATVSSITPVAGNGQSAVVSTPYPTALKVSVQDAEGNGIPGVSVTFTAPGSGASVAFSGPATVTTDSTGEASVSATANTVVGPFQVTATAAGIATPATFSLTNLPGTASRLTFVQQPSNASAGATITPPITVQLTDEFGHNVAQGGVTITLALNPVAGTLPSVSGTTTVQTNASGLATFSDLSIAAAGTYQFTALGASLASAQSNSFTISTGTPASIHTVAGTPQSTTVLAPFAVPLQVLVTDSFGNPLSGVTVTFAPPTSGASASLSSATATTDAAGHASVSATANGTAGSYAVTASVAGVTTPTSFALTNITGVTSNLTFIQQPANTPAGATITPPVQVRATDNGGNPLSGVTISLSAQGGPGVLSGATPVVTDASGLATFSNLSINLTGTYSLQATDGTHVATSTSFVITPGTASSITVVAGSGQSAAVGSPYATALKASVQDAHGNGVPGVAVTFSAPASGASVTFSGSTTVTTDSTGVASISATANTQVGSFQVTATAPSTPAPAVFSLTNVAGTASRLSFVQQPTTTVAGAVITPPVTVQLTDSVGNPISQSGVTITISLNPVTGRLRSISGNVATTNASGLATFSNLSISSAGSYLLTASGASLISAQSNQFVVSPSAPSAIQAIGGTPQSSLALTPFAVPLQVLVTDSFANPLTGVAVTFTAPASGASASLSSTTATTDANGHASVTATANSVVGSYAVTASVSGVTIPATFALTNVSGGGALLSFTQQPANTSAGAPFSATVKFTDSAGNPIGGASVSLAVTGGTGSLIGTLSATTNASGTATFSNLHIDVTGSYQLVASTQGISALSNTFQIGPAASRTITVISGNNQAAAAGDPYAVPLTVSVQDGLGNPVSGAQVTFTPPTAGASITFGGSATVTSGANGLASSPIATANSQPGLFQVSASTPGATGQATFNLQNLSATATRMQFVQQPANATAATAITPAVAVQLVDRFGNQVAQAGVSIQLFLASTTTVSGSITGATAQTNSTGLATFPNLSIAQAGTYQLLALATGFESSVSASFQITGGAPAGVTSAGGTPQTTTVLTTFAQPFVALVTDAAGNPLPGTTVTFTAPATGATGTFTGNTTTVTATTDANGRATSPVFTANHTAGTYAVTASVAAVGRTASFSLANLQPAALTLAFVTQPSNAASGAVISPPVRVQIEDSNGQPVSQSGVTVLLSLSQGTGNLSGTSVQLTDANGIATFSDLSINLAGPKRLQAFGSAEATVVSNQFQISAGAPSQLVPVSGSAQIAAPLGQFSGSLQVIVEDAAGNPVAGIPVTFSLPLIGSSGTFAGPAVVQSGSDGVATSPLITANGIQGVFNATASVANVANAEFALAIIQPSSGFLQANPASVQFGQSFGGPAPQAQTATIYSTSESQLSWTATSTAPWLSVSPTSGTTPGQITLTANGAGLAPGQYGALVTLADTDGDQQTMFVVFTVSGTATLVVQPSTLAFVAVVGTNELPNAVAPQQIRVTTSNTLAPITYKVMAQAETPAGGTWLTASPASGSTTGTVTVSVDTTGLQAGVYSGVVLLTPDDATISPLSVNVTLVVGCGSSGCPTPAPAGHAVTNAASFHSGGSPGGAHTIFGSYLAASTQTASGSPLPTSLAGTSVLVNGIAAPLFYVSPNQINFQMPSGTAEGTASIVVTTSAGSSSAITPSIAPVQPGLYVYTDLRAKALNQDLTLHTAQTPIAAGQYVVLYGTGFGPTTPPVADGQPAPSSPLSYVNGSVQAAVGGLPAQVAFAGLAPGFAGLVQINVQIPSGLSPGDQPVFVTVNGTPSNGGVITVK